MGRAPCCDKTKVNKGPWSPEEDSKLKEFIEKYGTGGNWIALPQKAGKFGLSKARDLLLEASGLKRCGKSCRLRWLNYLRPNIKHGEFTDEEDRVIYSLFASIGSRWSIIASQLPGRTDNDIKNYWNTKLKKKLLGILPPQRKPNQPLPFTLESPSSQTSCYTTSNPSTSFAGLPISPDLSSTTSFLQGHETFPGSLPHHHYQTKDSFLMFGGEQRCISSDASCNQISYSKENEYGDQMAFDSYFYSGSNETQKLLLGDAIEKGIGMYGEAPLDYGLEEIKQLISTNSCNFPFINDATATRGNKSQGKVMYY